VNDWAKSDTRWFMLDQGPGLIVTPGNRKGMLEALEHLGRQAGMCMTRKGDGTMCYEAVPCERDHG
jgi:hypothetical protein